ncbi:hypothetical protein C8Q76DRAFT_811414 [Earliella scabrosa]|nr:hypothetical protein C8Q76DRAFT_811414 [Earliella scabrosa]
MVASEDSASLLPYNLCVLSATVLTAYDAIITFDVELEVVWRRKPNLVSFLHVLNRYPQLAALVSTTVLSFPVSDASCHHLGTFQMVVTPVPFMSWALFTSFRTFALSNRSALLTTIVFVYIVATSTPVNMPPPDGCIVKTNNPYVADTFQRVPLVLNAISIATWAGTLGWDPSDAFLVDQNVAMLRETLTAVVISRFLLHLGELNACRAQEDPDTGLGALSSHFSSMASDVTAILPGADSCSREDIEAHSAIRKTE